MQIIYIHTRWFSFKVSYAVNLGVVAHSYHTISGREIIMSAWATYLMQTWVRLSHKTSSHENQRKRDRVLCCKIISLIMNTVNGICGS